MEDKITEYYEGWVSAAKDYMGLDEARARAVVDRMLRGLDIEIFNKIRDLAGVR